jgi:hypothetical protein
MKTGTSPRCAVFRHGTRQAWTLACIAAVSIALDVRDAPAQETLNCGESVKRVLDDHDVHSYRFTLPAGALVVIQRSDVSGTIGLIKLDAGGEGGGGTTCTEELTFVSRGGETTLEVSDCIDDPQVDESGEYTLVMNVVSETGNCGMPLPCGATADGIALANAGEADSFTFSAEPGHEVDVALTDLECDPEHPPDPGDELRMRVFGPNGNLVPDADVCGCQEPLRIRPAREGLHTVLVGSCRRPRTGRYRVSFDEEECPEGPTITFFGLATADSFPIFPDATDALGRPVYTRLRGHGASIVVEARTGSNGRLVDVSTVGNPLPGLQMLVSRPLGDGNPAVCDILPPMIGGVAGSPELDFSDVESSLDVLNDLGCRFDDGQGMHVGRTLGADACTRSNENVAGHDFVDLTTNVQYCAILARPWAFPFGETIVAARVADRNGDVGERREIVIRVTLDESTPTPSPTPTSTPRPATATPTPRPVAGCVADCNDSGNVVVDELIRAINIALGTQPMETCWPADDDSDGAVAASELVHAVANAVGGCNPE